MRKKDTVAFAINIGYSDSSPRCIFESKKNLSFRSFFWDQDSDTATVATKMWDSFLKNQI